MRSEAVLRAQKVTDKEADHLKPIRQRIYNYGKNGVEVWLETQMSREMTRGYKGRIILRQGSKEFEAIIDRDELSMALGVE